MSGVLSRFLARRSLDETNSQGLLGFLAGMGALWQTASGVTVTPDSSLQSATVFACVRLLADSVSSLPLHTYRRLTGGGKERAVDYPLYAVLHDLPNPEMTSVDYWSASVGHLCLWGNVYSEIETTKGGDIKALWPLRPDRTAPRRNPKTKLIEYVVRVPNETNPVVLPAERVMHVRAFGTSGLLGLSVIQYNKQTIGLDLAAEEFGARFFGNGAVPGLVLQHPGVMNEGAYARLRDSWREEHQGLSNAQRFAILEEGMTVEKIGIPPEDAQFLETRKYQRSQIAAMFHVPPHMIGDLDRASFSNIEQQSLDYVVNTLRPLLVRLEKSVYRSLMTPAERMQYFAEFLVDGLLRGDIASRYAAYATGRQWGWLSQNDIRAMENMNPIDGGDEYLKPLNMTPSNADGGTKGGN